MKQLGTPFYSISALTLGYATAGKTALATIRKQTVQYQKEDVDAIAVVWIQRLLARYAFDGDLAEGVRKEASRYPYRPTQPMDGLSLIHI